jgi:hypothetical protein
MKKSRIQDIENTRTEGEDYQDKNIAKFPVLHAAEKQEPEAGHAAPGAFGVPAVFDLPDKTVDNIEAKDIKNKGNADELPYCQEIAGEPNGKKTLQRNQDGAEDPKGN